MLGIPALSKKEKLYHGAWDNSPATIQQDIVTTSAHPDIVVIRGNKISLIELIVPYNSPEALSNARLRKRNKENYQLILSELDRKGFNASLIILEVGALGHSLPQTHSDLKGRLPCLTCSQSLPRARTELGQN